MTRPPRPASRGCAVPWPWRWPTTISGSSPPTGAPARSPSSTLRRRGPTWHSRRGLALSADGRRLLVAHEVLNPLAQTSRDDIHWGNLLTNNVGSLELSRVLDPKAELLRGSVQHHLGDTGHGTGDPS